MIELGKYKHYKGNLYEVLFIARHSETEEEMVVYKALYGEGQIWVQPVAMWDEIIIVGNEKVKRFTKIDD